MDSQKKAKSPKKAQRYFLTEETKEATPVDSDGALGNKRKRKDPEEIIKLRPKNVHKEKKKIVSQLKSLQEVLGNTRLPDEEETALETIVFGGQVDISDKEEDETILAAEGDSEVPVRKAAWHDEDDEEILIKEKVLSLKNCHRSVSERGEEKYSAYVQEKFKKIVGEPEWADLDRKAINSDGDSEDELLQETGNFITQTKALAKTVINIRKCTSLSHASLKNAIVKSVEFNRTSRVALVTGTNGVANLFQVDGKTNPPLQQIYFENYPVHTSHFSSDGTEVLAGSNMYGYFYSYDMLSGKSTRIPWQKGMEQNNVRRFQLSPDGKYMVIHGRYGNIHLVTAKSKEWIGSLKMNGEVVALSFNHDGSRMYSHGVTGEVYVWDMNSRKCIQKFTDEGCITGTSIAVSPNDQFLAAGSDSGIVNIYDCSTLNTSSPIPIKVVRNLTTEITTLKFNATTEVLAMGSSYKIGAARLMHVPSLSVFANFPTREDYKAIKQINSLDISPNSGYLVMGNNTGTALLYRLKHYSNY